MKAGDATCSMSKPVVEVKVRAVAASSGGFAVFLGNEEKVFVIFVDQSVGTAIAMFSLAAYGIMIAALFLLPETRGRSLLSLEQPAAE